MGFGNIGPIELVLVLGIAFMLFGAKRLPEIGRSFGKGIREFKRGISDMNSEIAEPPRATEMAGEPARLATRYQSAEEAR